MKNLFLLSVLVFFSACGADTNSSNLAPDATVPDTMEDIVGPADVGQTDVSIPDDSRNPETLETRTQPPLVPIGEPCEVDSDCGTGSCLLVLAGGYCTVPGCSLDNPCPEGSICVPIHTEGIKGTVCAKRCDMATDCRVDEGYACDRDMTCWPVDGGLVLHAEGGSCMLDTQCAADNQAVCYPEYYGNQNSGYPDGYCIIWNCKTIGCPVGTACVDVNADSSACFQECSSTADCREGYLCDSKHFVCLAGCFDQTHCPQKHFCVDGYCRESSYACGVTNPAGWCPDGQWCDTGLCTALPVDDSHGDLAEPNDSLETAWSLTNEPLYGLTVGGDEEDWFSIDTEPGLLTEVTLVFNNHAGNLDLLAWRDDGEFIRSRWINYPYQGLLISDFDVSGESVSFYSPDQERTFYLQVIGQDGAANSYGLVVRQYPYEDGLECTGSFPQDDCYGLPAGVMKMYQFPEPDPDDPFGGNNYQFETVSSYKWVRRETIMLIRQTLAETQAAYPYTQPVSIIDACQEDGVTPGYNIGEPRHCRTCHDEGGSIDVAFFATDGNNGTKTICGPDGTNVTADGMQCTTAAAAEHIVDLERQAFFMARLFDHPRVRVIGIDPVIAEVLLEHAAGMHDQGIISDEGWLGLNMQFGLWPTHHHHIHVSLEWWDHIYPGQE
jgi:hypothetical protein